MSSPSRAHVGWALFEFARTPYFGLVFIFAFAPYFADAVVGDPVRGQEIWSFTNTLVGICVGLLAPVLGAVADCTGHRKRWLAAVVCVMVPACFALWFAMPGARGGLAIPVIAGLIVLLNVSFEFSQVFHNAMLPSLAGNTGVGRLAGLGVALGNVGNLLATLLMLGLLAVAAGAAGALPFTLDLEMHEHDRIVGPISGLWLLLGSIPFFLWTPEPGGSGLALRPAVRAGIERLWLTLKAAKQLSNVGRYLVARMLYNDAMVAIQAYSGIVAVGLFGWGLTELLLFSICLSPCTILGAPWGGCLDQRFGSRRVIQVSVVAVGVFLVGALSMGPDRVFFMPYTAAGPVWDLPWFRTLPEVLFIVMYQALALGVTTAFVSSRAMMARISPPDMHAQFFGLYAVSGWATAFLGHGVVGVFTTLFDSQKIGFGAVILLLLPALVIVSKVREERAELER